MRAAWSVNEDAGLAVGDLTKKSENEDQTVCVLGMGFIGVTLSAVMAQVSFNVVGVEEKPDLVKRLQVGRHISSSPDSQNN